MLNVLLKDKTILCVKYLKGSKCWSTSQFCLNILWIISTILKWLFEEAYQTNSHFFMQKTWSLHSLVQSLLWFTIFNFLRDIFMCVIWHIPCCTSKLRGLFGAEMNTWGMDLTCTEVVVWRLAKHFWILDYLSVSLAHYKSLTYLLLTGLTIHLGLVFKTIGLPTWFGIKKYGYLCISLVWSQTFWDEEKWNRQFMTHKHYITKLEIIYKSEDQTQDHCLGFD